jgi:hypothetical protein
VRAVEQLRGLRVAADPSALDDARWTARSAAGARPSTASAPPDGIVILRIAPDEAFAVGATDVEIADPHAIVEIEAGFAGLWLTDAELQSLVVPHLEWPLPPERPALAQGSVAGVPARIWLAAAGDADPAGRAADVGAAEDGRACLLVTAAAYAHELETRLR